MNYLLTMTLSGSTLFLAYLILKGTAGRRMPKKWQYILLKAALLYYLIPLPFLNELYTGFLRAVWPTRYGTSGIIRYHSFDKIVVEADGKVLYSMGYQVQILIIAVWAIMAGVVFVIQRIKYLQHRKSMLQNAKEEADIGTDDVINTVLEEVKRSIGIKRDIRVLTCNREKTAFTIGIRKPCIILHVPESRKESELLLKHECIHIKRLDTLWKMIGSIALSLHWFNPLTYLFLREMEQVCEETCDELVVNGLSAKEREAYAIMLVKHSCEEKKEPKWANALSQESKRLLRRVKAIAEVAPERRWSNKTAAIITVVLVVANSFTALAYEDVRVIEANQPGAETMKQLDTMMVVLEGTEGGYTEHFTYNPQIVEEDGSVHPGTEESGQVYTVCTHDYRPALKQYHVEDEVGGCTVEYYRVKCCVKCERVVEGEYLSTATYSLCIH